MKNLIKYIFTSIILVSVFSSCKETIYVEQGTGLDNWTTETHTDGAGINYDIVFPQDEVNQIKIVLTAAEYASMQSNLSTLASQNQGQNFTEETPEYVACDFYFNDTQWYNVGIRYKGNSSLYSVYNSGNGKLPLRLKFDKFEDDYPEITNQRFYGFQDLSLGSNYNDNSYMREKKATELFREFEVPAVRTAFYEVYVDQGTGTFTYYGLYTMDEVVFDTMLNDQFGSNTGNCYKPDGDGAMFASNSFDLDDFEKKTNEDEGDWSDITELHDVLHSSLRTSDEETWKDNLEAVFDVQGFLKYLAANNTIQNWDTYANMTHNYYLYHDPSDDLIKWIVWDNNEAFSSGQGDRSAIDLDMEDVSNNWPLISYLRNVDSYLEDYKDYLEEFKNDVYIPSEMASDYDTFYDLINSSVSSETSGYTSASGRISDLSSAITELNDHCKDRNDDVESYIGK